MTWFKVDDKLHSNTKIRKVLADEPAALALWTVAGSWSSDELTDGFVPDSQLPWLLPAGAEQLAQKLVNARLWRRVRGGYQFHEYHADGDGTKRNPTREEVEEDRRRKSEAGRKGGLASGKARSKPEADAEADAEARASPVVEPPTRPDPTIEKPPNPPPAKPARRGRPTDDPDFDRFWAAYPKKADKGHALDMWRRHVTKGGADPQAVIKGAERYRDDPRRKPDYTKNAGTWLNGLCWEDQPAPQPARRGGWLDN
jgi:hypothetical protein